ncbi:MAG: anion permease [Candidatus Latescibacteria bacterium]|nr:anion permease [Candidatus Latescibacterota bacterium]
MEQVFVFAIIGLALFLFGWGKFRHDITAIICLLLLIFTRIIPIEKAFAGFAHPAVITVAVILIVSQGLQNSGLIDLIGRWVSKLGNRLILQIAVLSGIVCIASAFMNNIGALAIMMPVAMHIAIKHKHSPSLFLMPMAFASLLGGMMTLIGTPPNIIIATFRQDVVGEPFKMFDFFPVGAGLSLIGILFISLVAWRLLPKRVGTDSKKQRFNIDAYITEVRVTEKSKLVGIALQEINKKTETDIQVLNVIRNRHLIHAPDMSFHLKSGDILTIEADADELKEFIDKSGTELVGKGDHDDEEILGSENISNVEAVVIADAPIIRQSAYDLRMRSRYGVNLLAISRQGQQIRKRIGYVQFKVGDVLLLQGDATKIGETLKYMGCLPLADRGFSIGQPKKIILAITIFGLAIGLIVAGLVKVHVAFSLAALLMVLTKVMLPRDIYAGVDWPVIIMLAAMIPLGTALEHTGGATLIANAILSIGKTMPGWITLSILFIVTMLLSNIINNAATVVLMAPIGLHIASGLNKSADPFLMCVAIAASSAFLTPIGHQSNTLVMGPGGYKFTDFTRIGLPLSILIFLLSIPLVLYFWPW